MNYSAYMFLVLGKQLSTYSRNSLLNPLPSEIFKVTENQCFKIFLSMHSVGAKWMIKNNIFCLDLIYALQYRNCYLNIWL